MVANYASGKTPRFFFSLQVIVFQENGEPQLATTKHALQEKHMKYGKLIQFAATSSAVFAALFASATPLAAQVIKPKHSNYRVVDLGTFGGPHSQFNFNSRILNRKGTAVGGASTSTPDPLCQFDSPYCFVFHAGKYENGFFSDLGSLPGGANSFAVAV